MNGRSASLPAEATTTTPAFTRLSDANAESSCACPYDEPSDRFTMSIASEMSPSPFGSSDQSRARRMATPLHDVDDRGTDLHAVERGSRCDALVGAVGAVSGDDVRYVRAVPAVVPAGTRRVDRVRVFACDRRSARVADEVVATLDLGRRLSEEGRADSDRCGIRAREALFVDLQRAGAAEVEVGVVDARVEHRHRDSFAVDACFVQLTSLHIVDRLREAAGLDLRFAVGFRLRVGRDRRSRRRGGGDRRGRE